MLAGCTTPQLGPELAQEGSSPPDDTEAQPPADPDPQPDPAPRDHERGSDDPHGPEGSVPACDDRTVRAIDGVIGDQLAAFSRGDYEAALEFASEAFRSGVEAEDLARIIEDGYPVAADATAHETGVCVQPSPTSAEVLVEVTGGDGARGDLVYRLVTEDDDWRIAGAIQIEPGGPSAPATTVALRP